MMFRALLLPWLLAPLFAWAATYCNPPVPDTATTVTFGAAGSGAQHTTLSSAYSALPSTGGIIEVLPGTYDCGSAAAGYPNRAAIQLWAASSGSPMKNWIIRGLSDTNGNRPIFRCAAGSWIVFGPPYTMNDGVTMRPTPEVTTMVDNIEIQGWTNWITIMNARRLIVRNSKMDGRHDGTYVTGKGVVKTEMKFRNQQSDAEVCDSDLGHAGGGNADHPLYIHSGPFVDHGTLTFVNNVCREPHMGICLKTTVSGRVLVENNTFYMTCPDGYDTSKCGTANLDMLSSARLNLIKNNTFIRSNPINGIDMTGVAQITVSNRKLFNTTITGGMTPPAYPAGGEFSPLYDPIYQNIDGSPSTEWTPTFWENAAAGGDAPSNPYLRLTIFDGNTFTNYTSNASRWGILGVGTYPNTSNPYISDCLTLLPANGWIELSRLVLINNRFTGNWNGGNAWFTRGPNTCGTPYPPEMQVMPVWDLGGNAVNTTYNPTALPSWLTDLETAAGVLGSAPPPPPPVKPIAVLHHDSINSASHTVAVGRRIISSPPPSTLPLWRQQMQPYTWVRVGSNKLDDINPEVDPAINPDYPGGAPWRAQMGFTAAFTANWNGAQWDEANAVYWLALGGGHNGYAGNEGYKLDLSVDAPQWVRVNYPTGSIQHPISYGLSDGQEATGLYKDGRLRTGHTYDHIVYVPGQGPVWLYQSAVSFSSGNVGKTWAMNISTGEWANVAQAPYISSPYDMGSAWDSKRNVAYLAPTTANPRLHEFNPATNTWTANKFYNAFSYTGRNAITLQYLPEKDVVVEIFGPWVANANGDLNEPANQTRIAVWDLTANTHADATISGSPPVGVMAFSDYTGYSWDGARLLVWHNAMNTCQIGTLTPNTDLSIWTWGAMPIASTDVCPSSRLQYGTYKRFVYSRRLKGVVLQNDTSNKTFFYATE